MLASNGTPWYTKSSRFVSKIDDETIYIWFELEEKNREKDGYYDNIRRILNHTIGKPYETPHP